MHRRAYRVLLRAYPSAFREEHAGDLLQAFDDGLRDAQASGRRWAVAGYWMAMVFDLARSSAAAWIHGVPARARAPVIGASDVDAQPAEGHRGDRVSYLIALLPALAALLGALLAPKFMEPMFLNPPSLLGLPLGAVIWMGFVALIALGLAIARFVQPIWVARLLVAIVALVACLIVVLGPAIILFILNLADEAP